MKMNSMDNDDLYQAGIDLYYGSNGGAATDAASGLPKTISKIPTSFSKSE